MKSVELVNGTHPLPNPLVVGYCHSFLCRLRGLMFRKTLSQGEGLLLVGAREHIMDSAIHMMFVHFDLAVIWINSQGDVVDKVLARRWHPMYIPKRAAQYVLEISADRLQDFSVGDRILFHEKYLGR